MQNTGYFIPKNRTLTVPIESSSEAPLGTPTISQSPPASGSGGFNVSFTPSGDGLSGSLVISNQAPNNPQYTADVTVTFPGRAAIVFTAICASPDVATPGAPTLA